MEREQRFFRFQIFSSAEAILAFGLDDLVRLGVNFIWMGVETKSREANFTKNAGVDPQWLVRELRDRGINVLASGILCMEHHTQENIQEDIDHLVDLEADFTQFMLLTPLPTTALYQEKKASGRCARTCRSRSGTGRRCSTTPPALPRRLGRALDQAGLPPGVRGELQLDPTGSRTRPCGGTGTSPAWNAGMPASRRGWPRPASGLAEYALILPEIERHAVNELERERAVDLARRMTEALGKPGLRAPALPAGRQDPGGAVALAGLAVRGRHPADDAPSPGTRRGRARAGASRSRPTCPLPEAQEARRLPQAAAVGGR